MTTLKDIWENKRMTPTYVAGQAGISLATLYKINRKQKVMQRHLLSVLRVLDLTPAQYEKLEAEQ